MYDNVSRTAYKGITLIYNRRDFIMGDRGGKKDKNKSKKQKNIKQEQKVKKDLDKQPKRNP